MAKEESEPSIPVRQGHSDTHHQSICSPQRSTATAAPASGQGSPQHQANDSELVLSVP
jgi:hypothetical protein